MEVFFVSPSPSECHWARAKCLHAHVNDDGDSVPCLAIRNVMPENETYQEMYDVRHASLPKKFGVHALKKWVHVV